MCAGDWNRVNRTQVCWQPSGKVLICWKIWNVSGIEIPVGQTWHAAVLSNSLISRFALNILYHTFLPAGEHEVNYKTFLVFLTMWCYASIFLFICSKIMQVFLTLADLRYQKQAAVRPWWWKLLIEFYVSYIYVCTYCPHYSFCSLLNTQWQIDNCSMLSGKYYNILFIIKFESQLCSYSSKVFKGISNLPSNFEFI